MQPRDAKKFNTSQLGIKKDTSLAAPNWSRFNDLEISV